MADRDHARPAITASGDGGASEQAVPVGFVAELQADMAALAASQIVFGIFGAERHHATQRVGAVQRAARATQHLDLLQGVEIDEIAVGVGETADRERVRHRDAVGLDQHAVAAEPADADVADAETPETRRHRDARLVAEQILEVAHQTFVHRLAVDHIDSVRHIGQGARRARGDDDFAVEFMNDAAAVGGRGAVGRDGFRSGGLRERRSGGQGKAKREGQGQRIRMHGGLVS